VLRAVNDEMSEFEKTYVHRNNDLVFNHKKFFVPSCMIQWSGLMILPLPVLTKTCQRPKTTSAVVKY
jgi:hypothetical protein